MKSLNKFLILFFFIFSIPTIGTANDKINEYRKKSVICDGLFRMIEKGSLVSPSNRRNMVKNTESFMKRYPNDIIVKKCYAEAMKIYKSTDFTKPPKRKQRFIIANKEEYNKRPSVSFSNLSPDVRFLLESGAIGINWVKPSAIEIASRCILKARRDYPKSIQDSSGEINKIYIDFNRINWNTQDVIYGDGIYAKTRIKYSCRKNCHYDFGRTLFDYKVKWRPMKSISFYIRDSDNMFSRVTNALRDISKVCNKSTSKY